MIDSQFERDIERKAALLTNEGYFARVRELSQDMSIKQAWETVESELPFGLRRFTHYISFETARAKEAAGCLSSPNFKGQL